jgi:hypothetical protein
MFILCDINKKEAYKQSAMSTAYSFISSWHIPDNRPVLFTSIVPDKPSQKKFLNFFYLCC